MTFPPLDSQSLVDGLSAVALGAAATSPARRSMTAGLRIRLDFVLGGLCLFLAARATQEALAAYRFLVIPPLLIACFLPLSALTLAEGVLRRHAPAPLKIAIAAGATILAVAMLATDGERPTSSWGLGGYVVASLAAITLLLLRRDRAALSRQENDAVGVLMLSAGSLTLLSLTDFLPAAGLGLSGIGAAAMAFILSADPESRRGVGRMLTYLVALMGLSAVTAIALARPLGLDQTASQARLAVILMALLLAAFCMLGALRRRRVGPGRDFVEALAAADTASLDSFLTGLSDQPLVAGIRFAQASQLAEYELDGLAAAMARRPVWTRNRLGAGRPARNGTDRAHDELADLMARTEATHAMLISADPVRIAVLTLPEVAAGDEVEAHLALFRKLAMVAALEAR